MKKYIVETYYTCTFKTVHSLDNLDEAELSKIDQRTDGDVEVLDVKLNNRKTKKVGENKNSSEKIENAETKSAKLGNGLGAPRGHFRIILVRFWKIFETSKNKKVKIGKKFQNRKNGKFVKNK